MRGLAGGEVFSLGGGVGAEGREVRILHLPGHSRGHLGVHLLAENAAIIGDAVHGAANRFMDGRAAFACTYMYVDSYLGTIAQLRAMKLARLYSCHWADCQDNPAVEAFLDESQTYAHKAEAVILDTVQAGGGAGGGYVAGGVPTGQAGPGRLARRQGPGNAVDGLRPPPAARGERPGAPAGRPAGAIRGRKPLAGCEVRYIHVRTA